MGAPVTAQLLMNPSELWLWRCVHRHTRTACTCLAVREWHGALCCQSHLACWTLHDRPGLMRHIVCCAPHGASAARAMQEPPSSEPGNAQAGPPHPRSRASLGSSHPACRGRGLNGGSCRVHGGCSMRVQNTCGTSHTVPCRRPCPPDWSRLPRRTRRLHCSSCAGPREVGRGAQDDQRRVGCGGPRTLADGRGQA